MASVHQLPPGSVFARDFRILAPLAEGGMGAVYAAEQLSTGKRRALKLMLGELVSDPKARARFEQEARVAAQIPSEHVVEVVGAGIDELSGTPWLAMELLEGNDLSRVVKARGPLPADMVRECYAQLGHGLGMAHQRGIVHRDIKPENLFLAQSHRVGVPFTLKILDFGIAKLTQETRAATQQTAAMGSPLWMAPEQTQQSTLTPATDVWAMGLVAFFLLTGRVYWRAASQEEVSLAAVLAELLVSPLDPPTVRAAQLGVREPLPAGFDAWFARCVARSPTDRFPTATQAVAALGPGMSHRGDPSQPFAVQPNVPVTSAVPRIAPTVPLAAYAPTPAAALPLPSGPVAVQGSSPGFSPHALPNYGAAGSTPGAVQPTGLGLGARLLLYVSALVVALACTAGITFGALHAWQTYRPRAGGAPPPAPVATAPAPDVGPPMRVLDRSTDAGIDAPIDAGLDAGRAPRAAGRPTGERPAAAEVEPASEGGAFAWGDGEAHVFRGTGRFTSGAVVDFQLTLNRNGSTVDGFFHWTVREVPAGETGLYVGQTLDEAVSGSWSAPSCELATVGTSESVDIHLRINDAGRLTGRDAAGTRYSGRVTR